MKTTTLLLIALAVALFAGAVLTVFSPGRFTSGTAQASDTGATAQAAAQTQGTAVATFAGGCFWCVETDFEKAPGVIEAISGYTGGHVDNPTYKQVSSGSTGHLEAVQVRYDPSVISYEELLGVFWRIFDPTDDGGSFVDRGQQYTSAIFVHDAEQRRIAEASKARLDASGRYDKPVITPILDAGPFFVAEDYHQDYYKKSPIRYKTYRHFSGRDTFLDTIWGKDMHPIPKELKDKAAKEPHAMDSMATQNDKTDMSGYVRPPDAELKKTLTSMQYEVTQEEGTEPPFRNEYYDNKRAGIYVDVVSGEPLFSSTHKYKSGTGWPSFWQPLEPDNIVEHEDRSLFMTRIEVRSKHADSHLGHVFNDGPQPTGLRYCLNSAALRFIPAEELEEQGYGKYASLFNGS